MTTLTIEDALVAEELPPLKETEIRFKSRPAAQLHAKHVLSNSTALHQSILDGRMHSLNYFLKMGFKPNTKDKYGRTSLMLACLSDHESYGMQVAKLLFKHGADVNEQDSLGRTAVFIAISENREALFDYFIDHQSSSMDFKLKDNDGNALINHAAMYGNSRMVRKVINVMKERGIDLDMRNKSGFTALLLAIQSDRFLNAYILLKHGQCSTTLKDNDRRLNAIEWLLNRIEVNKDILLNTPEKPETNLNVVPRRRSMQVQPNGVSPLISPSFTNSYDSLSSKNSLRAKNHHPPYKGMHKSLLADSHHLKPVNHHVTINIGGGMGSLLSLRSQNTKQYFQIESFCEHVPKANMSVDHHSSRFMPLVSMPNKTILKNPADSKAAYSSPLNLLNSSRDLDTTAVSEERKETNGGSANSTADEADETTSLKDIVKKLYDNLYDRMLEVSRARRAALMPPKKPDNAEAAVAATDNKKTSLKDAKKQNSRKKLVLNESNLAQVNEDKNADDDSQQQQTKSMYPATTKIELSLDKEIFDMDKMRMTPKLLAMQRRQNRKNSHQQPTKSVKEAIHGILNLYDTEQLLVASTNRRLLHRDSVFEVGGSVDVNDFDMSVSRLHNAKSSVSFMSNREKNSVML